MDATEQGFVNRIRDLATEAQTHLNSAVDAHDGTNDSGVAASHRALGGCLRAIERVFVTMGRYGAKAGSDANKKVGTSEGITTGVSSPPSPPRAGSAGGRATAPQRRTPGLMTGSVKDFLDRARQGGRNRKA